MHWLTGSSSTSTVHQIWQDTGAIGGDIQMFYEDPFRSVEHNGQVLRLYRDIDKTAAHLTELAPEDGGQIAQLAKWVKKLSVMDMPITDIKGVRAENPKRMGLGDLGKLLPLVPLMGKLGKISSMEYLSRFNNLGLRRLFGLVPDNFKASSLVFTLATLNRGDGGYPEGGSLGMTQRMADTFCAQGGELRLGVKVNKVLMENGRAAGVLVGDERLEVDAVIVTQETIGALDTLFDVPPNDGWLQQIKTATKPVACTFVGIGIAEKLPDEIPGWMLPEPITIAGKAVNELAFYTYPQFPQYAPTGGTVLTTAFLGDSYDFWAKAKEDGRYKAEKDAVADQISRAICAKFPEASSKIEVVDVSTPLTYQRYAGADRGAWMTVMEVGSKMVQHPGTVADVDGLFFAGHRLTPPGGLPVAASSGRQAVQLVCRQFDVLFR